MIEPQKIVDGIVSLCSGKRVWIAYSGGVDSHVLLHLLATVKNSELVSLNAFHVDHKLLTESKQWARHCADVAAKLNVNFTCIAVDVDNIETLGMEAAARASRYGAIQQKLTKDDVVLMAQHQHDQAETLLLQLLRGAGPKGLSAMASQFQLGETTVIRPLLEISQADILSYAKQHHLQWINDPSNIETRWNRNYIRHNVWPNIEQRWPAAAKTLSRSAVHCAEASELMTALAKQDLAQLGVDISCDSIPITGLLALTVARLKNVLRYYIEVRQFVLPSAVCLQHIIDEVCLAEQDSMPVVSWEGVEVRRYQDQLYFMSPLVQHDVEREFECHHMHDLSLNDGRKLVWQHVVGQGLKQQLFTSGLHIRFRQGGEQIRLPGRNHRNSLKHLFQQWGVPPWQRNNIPLIYCNDELIGVVGFALAEAYAVNSDESGLVPSLKSD